jgi:hypothetical protein
MITLELNQTKIELPFDANELKWSNYRNLLLSKVGNGDKIADYFEIAKLIAPQNDYLELDLIDFNKFVVPILTQLLSEISDIKKKEIGSNKVVDIYKNKYEFKSNKLVYLINFEHLSSLPPSWVKERGLLNDFNNKESELYQTLQTLTSIEAAAIAFLKGESDKPINIDDFSVAAIFNTYFFFAGFLKALKGNSDAYQKVVIQIHQILIAMETGWLKANTQKGLLAWLRAGLIKLIISMMHYSMKKRLGL